jgi:hypothetical protein
MALNPILGGYAAADLGLGSQLSDQVKNETDEERKKRLARQNQLLGSGSALSAAGGALLGGSPYGG